MTGQNRIEHLQSLPQMQLHQQYQRLQAEHITALVQALDAIRVVQVCVSVSNLDTYAAHAHTQCIVSCGSG